MVTWRGREVLRLPYIWLSNHGIGEQLTKLLVTMVEILTGILSKLWQLLPKKTNLTMGFLKDKLKTIASGVPKLAEWVVSQPASQPNSSSSLQLAASTPALTHTLPACLPA